MNVEIASGPLFSDRIDAGRRLAHALEAEQGPETVVVGLARGGVQVAAEVARALEAPLDTVAVRKVGHPWQPEYAIGAVTPHGGVYLRASDGLTAAEAAYAVAAAREAADLLDRSLHATRPPLDVAGKRVLLVDDGLATGSTMIAAARWARGAGAGRVVAAVPVAAAESAAALRAEVDALVTLAEPWGFLAVGLWYETFTQVGDGEVRRLLEDAAATEPTPVAESEAAGVG